MKVSSSPAKLHRAADKAEQTARRAQGSVGEKTSAVQTLEGNVVSLRASLTAELRKSVPDANVGRAPS